MVLRNWGDPIVLTDDSDDDVPPIVPPRLKQTPVPLPENVRHRYPPPTVTTAHVSAPRKTPIPLPENVRHLVNQPSSSHGSVTPANRATPYISPNTTGSSVGSGTPSSTKRTGSTSGLVAAHDNRVDRPYVPVFSKNRGENGNTDSFGLKQQPEKRRKLLVPEKDLEDALRSKPAVPTNGGSHDYDVSPGIYSSGKYPRARNHGGNTNGFTPAAQPEVPLLEQKLAPSDLDESVSDDDMEVPWDAFKPRRAPIKKDKDYTESQRSLSLLQSPLQAHQSISNRPTYIGGVVNQQTDDPNSVMSPIPLRMSNSPLTTSTFQNSNATAPGAAKKKFTNRFTTEEDHLLIFLKEVKNEKWSVIEQSFPGRKWNALQSRYSSKLNKRDRSLDPPRLSLPPQYAAESVIDWPSVHQATVGYTVPLSSVQHASAENSGAELEYQHVSSRESHNDPSGQAPIRRRRGRPRRDEQLVAYSNLSDNFPRNDSSSRRNSGRPRRSVQVVDYTWPRQRRKLHLDEDWDEEYTVIQDTVLDRFSDLSEEPSVVAPEVVIPTNEPMEVCFDQENADLVVSSQKLPYISSIQRAIVRKEPANGDWDQLYGRTWQGTVFHVDFSNEEMEIACRTVRKVIGLKPKPHSSSLYKVLRSSLKDISEPKLLQLSHELRSELANRSKPSIDAFIQDARNGKLSRIPHIDRLGPVRPYRVFSSSARTSTSALVRQRELGLQSRRGWKTSAAPLTYRMKNNVYDTLGPAYIWTGASGDVHAVAWSPDGQYFAGGAVAVTDQHSMQYNRPKNLLYGDLMQNTIHELAEHRERRKQPESGPNSTHAMHVSQDRWLYHTVSSVAFSPDGDYMFSGGYDQSAMIWRRWEDGSPPTLMKALKHRAEVDILAVNRKGVLATAAKRWKKAIKVCRIRTEDDIVHSTYSSKKADQRPDQKILPTALQFEPEDGRLLLAGFGANKRQDRLDTTGDICLWDIQEEKELNVHGSALNIFDISWMPNQIERKLFAVGCVAGQNVNRGTRSVVRLYDGRGHDKRTMVVEIECPALDMNDLVICPHDEYLVAAGCTSGRTYVWDFRRPDSFLYSLSHGKSAMPLDEFEDRELTDTGVRFLSWGDNVTRLYTGSSDGIVKVWDVARSEQDVFIKDLVKTDSGIMSGSFSPDKSRLIVGEVNGSINVLEVGKDDNTLKDATRLRYLPYEDDFEDTESVTTAASAHTDSGQAIASELLNTGQMVNMPFGGFPIRQTVQGPNYAGPFDRTIDAPFLREQALEFQLNQPQTSEPHCSIPACSDAIAKTTFEEIGDSGRSSDRIPNELREQWKMIGSDLTVNPGKSKCSSCGRPARISDSVTFEQDKPIALCERCHFSCFRCGAVCDLDPATSKLICSTCSRVWDVGVLGYECLEDTGHSIIRTDVPSLEGFGRDLKQDFLEADASFGDEMNALTDHYFNLAIDRPESPPL